MQNKIIKEFEDILLKVIGKKKISDWHSLVTQEIGFEILKDRFDYRPEKYEAFLVKLKQNPEKQEQFEDAMKFYYFWCRRPSVYDVLKPDFKLIIMFSVIEFLMSDNEFLSLDNWLQKEMKENQFSIKDTESLNAVLEKYYNIYGSQRKIVLFFKKYYSVESLEKLKNSIKKFDDKSNQFNPLSDVKEVADFVIGLRNLFIHRATDIQISSRKDYDEQAQGYTDFSSSLERLSTESVILLT